MNLGASGALPPGPPSWAWSMDPIRLGLGGKPLKRRISQKIFTSWFLLPDSKKYFDALFLTIDDLGNLCDGVLCDCGVRMC